MAALGTHRLVAGECVFGFGDAAAALADHGELGERERVVWFQFHDLLRVSDRFVELAELLHHHGQGGMRQGVGRNLGHNRQQLRRGFVEVPLVFQSDRFVVQFVVRRHRIQLSAGAWIQIDSFNSSIIDGSGSRSNRSHSGSWDEARLDWSSRLGPV
ncbi:MAG: hypothetical protein JWP89_3816 [Schlesneria sp.]|nr:hypothetical protein [Schlesneria sp.]